MTHAHTWRTEFPDFPGADMPDMPRGFEDASWHNDAMPCFINLARRLAIWVDYADPDKREFGHGPRFFITKIDGEGQHTPDTDVDYSSDDWQLILSYVGA